LLIQRVGLDKKPTWIKNGNQVDRTYLSECFSDGDKGQAQWISINLGVNKGNQRRSKKERRRELRD